MQLIRQQVPAIFDESFTFDPQTAVKLAEGDAVTVISTGYATHIANKAVKLAAEKGLRAEHLHYTSVKPFDTRSLLESVKKTGAVITVENQNIIGGLGSAVCEELCLNYPAKVKRLGVPDKFGEVATEDYLCSKHRFSVDHIVEEIEKFAK
jgi:transketolase